MAITNFKGEPSRHIPYTDQELLNMKLGQCGAMFWHGGAGTTETELRPPKGCVFYRIQMLKTRGAVGLWVENSAMQDVISNLGHAAHSKTSTEETILEGSGGEVMDMSGGLNYGVVLDSLYQTQTIEGRWDVIKPMFNNGFYAGPYMFYFVSSRTANNG